MIKYIDSPTGNLVEIAKTSLKINGLENSEIALGLFQVSNGQYVEREILNAIIKARNLKTNLEKDFDLTDIFYTLASDNKNNDGFVIAKIFAYPSFKIS
jgi:hypothetical protein